MAHNRNVDSMFVSAAGMVLACLFAIVPTPAAFAENWTQFRGDDYSGVAQSQFPEVWDETQNVRWKIRVNGEGWSCPVVWEDNVFLTVAVPVSGDAQASRPQPYTGGGGQRRTDLQNKTFRWDVICLDAGTGKERWRQTARTGKPPMPRHSSNSYATETPVTDGKHVYAYFGMNGVYCYDITGTPVWQKDLGSFEMRAGWGTSSSPVLFDGKMFVQVDNEEQSFLVALDGATGNEVWRVQRDEASQYSTPIIWQNSLRAELIVGGMFYRSYDPASGKLLWQLDMEKGRSSATPIASGDRLYVGTELRNRGGADDGGGYLFAVKPGGDGDISPPTGQTSSNYIAWKLARSGIQMASPAICGGRLYLLDRRSGILNCVNAENGEVEYRTRIPGARAFWASPWSSKDRIFCLDDGGTTFVLAAGPKFELVSKNVIKEQAWSSPAISQGNLYLRTIDHLYCIGNPDQTSTALRPTDRSRQQ